MKDLTLKPKNLKSLLSLLFLLFILVFGSVYILDNLHYYKFDKASFNNGRLFWDLKWTLIIHITAAILIILIGPFQFWTSFRNKYLKFHRKLGFIYLISTLIAASTSLILCFARAPITSYSWSFSLLIATIVWFFYAFMAYKTIREKRIERHKEWMIRSYLVAFGVFAVARFILNPEYIYEYGSFLEVGPSIIWASWVIPVFIADIIFGWNKKKYR